MAHVPEALVNVMPEMSGIEGQGAHRRADMLPQPYAGTVTVGR